VTTERSPLQGRRVLLGVTGGIAAYKACELVRLLVDHGRHQKREKRGGGAQPIVLDELLKAATTAGVPIEDLLTLEAALTGLRTGISYTFQAKPCS